MGNIERKAGELAVGDQVVEQGDQFATVTSTQREPHEDGIAVYNFEVEGFHTYFVSAHGARAPPVWVHNAECAPKKTRWQYITEWHDKRVRELFGGQNNGRNFSGIRREYDAHYNGRDIEFKSDNFGKKPRSQQELDRMRRQMDKDIELFEDGLANPHWHFDHDPTDIPEMRDLLSKLDDAGVPWTFGPNSPF